MIAQKPQKTLRAPARERRHERALARVHAYGPKLVFSVLIAIFCLVCFAGTALSRGPKRDSVFESALMAFNAGKLDEAERLVEAAEKADPRKPDIPNLRGAILVKQKRYDQAAEAFSTALALDSNFYEAKLNLAEVNLRQGKCNEAAQLYDELQKIDPDSETVQFNLILCALISGDIDRASAMADTMIFPGKTPAYYFARAAIALKRGNRGSAEKYFENAKKYYPEEECAYFARSLKELDLVQIDPSEPSKGKAKNQQKFD